MATLIKYLAEIGWKTDWQKNKAVPADPIFLDNNEPNRGLNARSSQYSGVNDYELYIVFDAVVNDGVSGTNTVYRAISPALDVNDYDEPAVSPRDFNCVIEIFDITETRNITNFIDLTAKVLMKVTWTLVNGGNVNTDYPDAWAIHRLEKAINSSYNIFECSSIRSNDLTSVIQPIDGQDYTTVQYVGNDKIITRCVVDGTQLGLGTVYKLSARLGLPALYYSPPTALIDNITPDTDTGITAWDLTLTANSGSFVASDTIELKVYRVDTGQLLETITGNYNSDISTFVSDITDSVVDYSTGTMDGAATIAFNKLAWATSKGFLNLEAVALRYDLTITQTGTGLTSNIATGTFAIELQEAEYSGDLRYLQSDGRKVYTGQPSIGGANVVGLDLTQRFSELLFTPNNPAFAFRGTQVKDDSTFGTPWSRLVVSEAGAVSPYQSIVEYDTADGINWTPSVLISNIAGANKLSNFILVDDVRTANGEPVYWVGTEDSAITPNKLLYMIYFDGAAWLSVDFSSKLASVKDSGAQRLTACISKEGDIYGTADANRVSDTHRVWRLQQTTGVKTTVADFINLANWANATVMCGSTVAGSTDGNGTAARFREMFNMVTITEDADRPLTMWVTDGGNDVIRLLTYNAGSDNYDVTTIIGAAGIAGDTNGIGTAARLSDCRGLVVSGANAYIGDFGNKLIRKVVISTLAVTTFSGTGDNSFRLASLY